MSTAVCRQSCLYCLSLVDVHVGAGAFADWMYLLKIRAVSSPPGTEVMLNTSSLFVLLENLQPETLYEIVLSACGPGGCQMTQDKLVFSTKSAGN